MRVVLCFLLIIFSGLWAASLAQPDTLWTKRVSSDAEMNLFAATALADGGFAVAGVCTRGGSQDVIVAKLSSDGALLWSHAFGDASVNEQANAVVELPDHTLMLVGQSAQTGQPSRTFLAMGVSAAGDSLWTRSYSVTTGQRKGMDAVTLSDGSIAAVGFALGLDGAHSDVWLLKLNSSGDTLWTRMFGGPDIDSGSRLMETSDGGFMLAGQTRSYGLGDYDVWFVYANSNGDSTQARTFGTATADKCFGLGAGYGRTFIGGRTVNASGGGDAYLVALDVVGFPALWMHVYDNGMDEEQISGVAARPGGGAVCVGWSGASITDTRPWLFRVNDEGTLEQSWVDNTSDQGQFNGVLPVSGGGYIAWGTISENLTVMGYVVRYAPTGEVVGTVHEAASGQVMAGAHVGIPDASECATTNSHGQYSLELVPGMHDIAAWGPCASRQTLTSVPVALDSATHENFELGTPDYQCPQTSVNLVVHNHVMTSTPLHVTNPGTGELELWVTVEPQTPGNWLSVDPPLTSVAPGDFVDLAVRVNPDTTDDGVFDFFGYVTIHTYVCPDSVQRIPVAATVLDVPARDGARTTSFDLEPAFPNPFNPVTTLEYSVPRDTHVSLKVYDVTGRQVVTLLNEMQSAGVHRSTLDGRSLASGIYWVKMNAGEFTARQKVVLLK